MTWSATELERCFPMLGSFLVPVCGLLLALVLGFIRPLRFLATFAFFMPLLGAYSAVAGFWGLGLTVERPLCK